MARVKSPINKAGTDGIIREKTMRNQIGKEVVSYLTVAFRRLLLGIIQADNDTIKPNSEAILRKKHVKEAIKTLDENYGLRGILKLETEPNPVTVDLEKSGKQVDLVIRLSLEGRED
ncbi:hypothetical protein AKJ51_01550 [candidate division MSBL1 archaeon SCGC-AAA382A20]|uniref:Uncharacterized protein n=1 Tax=candidate division MSBL1 archaeon SCGC-AAA382A20 TaxID=1698280 RepID=A0A133VLK1_9EURY|nr:hypothetical protein AKJ51_01550 [candidate division MSBL1 archaeon SCGC-AAA382A20]